MTFPRTLLGTKDLLPKKELGQNFLADPGTAAMIVARSGVSENDVVLEIGSGLGALTVPLAAAARQVFAVETDGRIIDLLTAELAGHNASNVTLIHQDILRVNIPELAQQAETKLIVVGNLPYNISSQILVRLIENRSCVRRCIFMFQKELADRLVAGPDCRDYGRLSVILQYCSAIRTVATVKAHLFYPRPKIDSEVIEIDFSIPPRFAGVDEPLLFAVVKAAFSKRRKTLKNALSTSELALGGEMATRVLTEAGIDPMRRAETLTVEEFVALTRTVGNARA